jgi:hypothetical protein
MMLADSIRNPKYSWGYSEVDATLRRHEGAKAYMKGMLEVSISFTLPNEKNTDGTRPPDTTLLLKAMRERHYPITIIMVDEANGEGPVGDFELFGGDKSEEDENLQAWEIDAKPAGAGRKVDWYTTPAEPPEPSEPPEPPED